MSFLYEFYYHIPIDDNIFQKGYKAIVKTSVAIEKQIFQFRKIISTHYMFNIT